MPRMKPKGKSTGFVITALPAEAAMCPGEWQGVSYACTPDRVATECGNDFMA